MKRLFLIFLIICVNSNNFFAQCENSDFESGSLVNWMGFTGGCCGINTPQQGFVNGRHTITQISNGFDPQVIPCFELPVVSNDGDFSCRLGNSDVGAEAERLQFDFLVTPESNLIIYKYAVVLEDPGHDIAEQPRFEVQVKTASGSPIPCTFYQVSAAANLEGFQNCGGLVFKDWTTVGVDVSDYLGQIVTLDLATGDCSQGGHFGYAYVDAKCTSLTLDARFCSLANSATISAPDGFTYFWSTGETTKEITITNPQQGQEYSCQLTSVTGCQALLSTTLEFSDVDAQIEVLSACTNFIELLNNSVNVNGYVDSVIWTVNGDVYFDENNLILDNFLPGNYDVELLVISDLGCRDSIFTNLEVFDHPEIHIDLFQPCYSETIEVSTQIDFEVSEVQQFSFYYDDLMMETNINGQFNSIGGDDLNHEFVVIATDELGCRDTSEEFFFSPSQIQLDLLTISDYNGFQISCNQGNDGFIEVQNAGGFVPITSEWSTGDVGLSVNGLTAGYYMIISTDAQGCQDTIFQELMEPTAISTVVTGTSEYNGSNVSCFGSVDGYISFSVYGGVQPYAYTFDNLNFVQSLFENINGGVHDFVVSDANNCLVNQTVNLTEPAPLTIDVSVVSNYNGSDISCFGAFDGQAQAQVTGGTVPYFYQWSDGSISMLSDLDLGQGAANVDIVDINGCTTSGQINLMEPAPLGLTTAVTSNYNGFGVSCLGSANAAVTSYPSGGTGAYIFDWNDGAGSSQNLNNVQAGLYQLELTDQNGCGPVFSSILVTQPDSLVLNLNVTSNFNGYHISCNSEADGSVQSEVNGGVLPYLYDWNNAIDGISNAFDLTAGTVELTVTDDNNCQVFGSIQLEEPPALLIQMAVVSNFNGYGTSCFNSQDGILFASATGGIGSYNYTWDNGVNGSINAGLGSGIYSVEVIDGNGCMGNESTTLYSPTPVLGQVESQSNYNGFEVSCFGGADGEVNLSASGGIGPYYFLWPDGVVSSLHQNLTAGTYGVQVEDVNGCQQNIQVDINQPNSLEVSVVSVSDFNGFEISCFNVNDGFIHAAVTGGVAPFIYQWTSGVSASPELNNIPAGNYGLTVLDNNGCVSDAVSQLMEQPNSLFANVNVVSNYNGSQISCFGLSDAQAEVSIGGGVDPYYPEWEDGSTQFLSNVNLNVGLHQVTYVDANGCYGSLTFSVIEPEPVVASVQSILDYNGYEISCYGYNDGAAVVTCEGGTGFVSSLWNDGFSGYYRTGMYSGTYVAACTDLNGCMTDDQVVLDQPAPLSLDLEVFSDYSGWDISCYGYADGQALCNVLGGVVPYSYNWEDGSIMNFSNQDLSAGTFTVQVTDINGCYIEDSITLTQPDAITHNYQVSDFSGFGVSCFGGSNGSIDVTAFGGANPLSYVWSSGQFTQDLFGMPSGVYALEISDANGCPSQYDLIELTQPDEIILETVLISDYNGYNVSCFNSTDGFAEVVVYGGVPDYNINWDNGDQGLLADQLSGGIHLVTVNDANGCVDVEQLFMDVPSPIVLSQISLPDTCFLGIGSSTIAASGGVGDYLYLWNNGGMLPASCCLTSGYDTWVTVIDDNFCQSTMNVIVDNIPPPNVSLEIVTNYPICEDSTEVVLFANTSDEYVNWKWYFNGEIQLDESGVLPIVFNEPHDVEVELVGSFANGCSSSVSQVLEVEPIATLYVPNAFTPDDDYINDGFVVRGSQLLSYHIMIFDRWGHLYFESDDIRRSWNGTLNNSMENAKSDVYMYKVEATGLCGEEIKKVGHVILLR